MSVLSDSTKTPFENEWQWSGAPLTLTLSHEMYQSVSKTSRRRGDGDGPRRHRHSPFGMSIDASCPLGECRGGFQHALLLLLLLLATATKNIKIGHITPFLCFPRGLYDQSLSLYTANRKADGASKFASKIVDKIVWWRDGPLEFGKIFKLQ